jgi:hypothetical protein
LLQATLSLSDYIEIVTRLYARTFNSVNEDIKMHNSTEQTHTANVRMTSALLDGLVTLSGLAIATAGYFYEEIMMWWVGA